MRYIIRVAQYSIVQYSIVENKFSRDCHVILFHNSNITVRCWQYIIYLHDSIQFDSIIDITFNMVVESIILHRGWLPVPCQSISNILEPAYQITLHDPFLGSVHRIDRSVTPTHVVQTILFPGFLKKQTFELKRD